jgi:hypothetical protein
MPKTTRERVALHRLRKEADAFYEKYLDDELVTVSEFVIAIARYDCDRGGYAQVKYPKETLAAFKSALGNPKKNDEIHYEDLYITWGKNRKNGSK